MFEERLTKLDDLPNDILEKIILSIDNLDVETLNKLIRVSKKMHDILSEPKFKSFLSRQLIADNQPHGKVIIKVSDEQQQEILEYIEEEKHTAESKILDTEMNCEINYFLGKIHSISDKPAVIRSDGTKKWYKNNLLHRDNDKPAIIYGSGANAWYQNGLEDRDGDKPALILADGTKYWFKNGEIHRDISLGPAIIYGSEHVAEYWVNGKFLRRQKYYGNNQYDEHDDENDE